MTLLTTFDTVYQMLKSECNRGNSVDTVLGSKIQQAVGFIERNYTLKYMEKFVRFQIFPGPNAHGPYNQPAGLKSTILVRITLPDRTLHPVRKFESLADQTVFGQGVPDYFWEDGSEFYWFDSALTPTDTGEAEYLWCDVVASCYTPRLVTESTCWLFDYGMDVVLAKTMQLMAPWMRQPSIMPAYQELWTEGIKTLLLADSETRRQGTEVQWGQNG